MRARRWLVLSAAALAAVGLGYLCQRPEPEPSAPEPASLPTTPRRIREEAVAGSFYPDDPEQLTRLVDRYLAEANPEPVPNLRGLVCPHAGYVYSGPTAAYCYRLLQGRSIDPVLILAPSHHASFDGVSIAEVDAYRTPLGLVGLSAQAQRFAEQGPFTRRADAHAEEHAVEVQLPFLQRVLGSVRIVPMVFGRADVEQVARYLGQHWDPKSLVIASSDLSHYQPYEIAQRLDHSTIEAILELDAERMRGEQACGKLPIITLLLLARQQGWKAKLLDYRNSGDTTGTKSRVVGYAAIALYEPGARGTR